MKTVELRGIVVEDVSSLWEDLLKKEFDVQSVGLSPEATYVYLADDEEKDPRPVIESWVGRQPAALDRKKTAAQVESVRMLLDQAVKRRAERRAERASAEAKEKERAVQAADPFFQMPAVEAVAAAVPAPAPPPKEKLLSKLFKVFRS